MSAKSILFSPDMVQANLDGRKNQTRRLQGLEKINVSPADWHLCVLYHKENKPVKEKFNGNYRFVFWHSDNKTEAIITPRIQPGDLLWVRESFYALGYKRFTGNRTKKTSKEKTEFVDVTTDFGHTYKYDGQEPSNLSTYGSLDTWPAYTDAKSDMEVHWIKRPSLFMPMLAARLFAVCTGVRVERLNDISEQDCIDEGIEDRGIAFFKRWKNYGGLSGLESSKKSYQSLWESINGPGSWENNPWVLIYDYKLITKEEFYAQLT